MAVTVSTGGGGRITGVGVAQPGVISGVGVAQPGVITGVDVAHPPLLTNLRPAPPVAPAPAVRPVGPQYGAGAPAQVYAPALDLNVIRANARAAAEGAVNPLYTQQLNTFLAREAQKRARAQQDYGLNVQNLDESLSQALEANALSKSRTTEDVATNIQDINNTADQVQNVQGQQFEDQRIADARALASAGLAGTGIGNQRTNRAVVDRNVTEQQQAQDILHKKVAQEVLKARSFEDLAKSGELATLKTTKGKTAAKLDLDRLIEDVDYEEKTHRNELEQRRYESLASETARQAKIAVQNFIAGIRDPAQRQAAYAAYGNSF